MLGAAVEACVTFALKGLLLLLEGRLPVAGWVANLSLNPPVEKALQVVRGRSDRLGVPTRLPKVCWVDSSVGCRCIRVKPQTSSEGGEQ